MISTKTTSGYTTRYVVSAAIFFICASFSQTSIADNDRLNQSSCLRVTLTGTNGGPTTFDGLTGPGTLVEFGQKPNCANVRMQFDAGRGTTQSLSKLGVRPTALDLLAFTHLHSDHVDGFSDLILNRWHSTGVNKRSNFPPLEILCSNPQQAEPPAQHILDCGNLVANIDRPFKSSGEIAQRLAENPGRTIGGPSVLTRVVELNEGNKTPAMAWNKETSLGQVTVSYIRVSHIPGSLAYRVDTPAGSVVIGGDAANEQSIEVRATSTSDNTALLAKKPDSANIIVHSATSNILAPGSGYPTKFYARQSTAEDLGSLAKSAGVQYLMLTHLIPAIGATKAGAATLKSALTAEDWKTEAATAGFPRENIIVGPDRISLKISKSLSLLKLLEDFIISVWSIYCKPKCNVPPPKPFPSCI